jgi:hypothetical protein
MDVAGWLHGLGLARYEALSREHLGPYYSDVGRPSIDPEMMRMLIVGYRSERRLCDEVHLNLACRSGLDGDVPDHSTFSKNRHGRFRDSDLLRLASSWPTTIAGARSLAPNAERASGLVRPLPDSRSDSRARLQSPRTRTSAGKYPKSSKTGRSPAGPKSRPRPSRTPLRAHRRCRCRRRTFHLAGARRHPATAREQGRRVSSRHFTGHLLYLAIFDSRQHRGSKSARALARAT